MLRAGYLDIVKCDVLHQQDGVEILLIADAAQVVKRQAHHREHGCPVSPITRRAFNAVLADAIVALVIGRVVRS
jgi:hypothetical protein